MIHEVLFPQVPIQEQDDPQIEIHPCVTSYIKDLPDVEQKRVEGFTGSRLGHFKSFKLATKVVGK